MTLPSTTPTLPNFLGEKDDINHIEGDKVDAPHEQIVQKKSSFDNLTWWQTITTFRRAVLICGVVGISAATDGRFSVDVPMCFS